MKDSNGVAEKVSKSGIAAIDIGRFKTAAKRHGKEGVLLSEVGMLPETSGSLTYGAGGAGGPSDEVVTLYHSGRKQGTWAVGESALLHSVYSSGACQYDQWFDSVQFEALLCAALGKIYSSSMRLEVCTGLPVEGYARLADSAGPAIKGAHEFSIGPGRRQTIEVERVFCFLQPMGALAEVALRSDGTVKNSAVEEGVVGVVDIGAETMNLFATMNMREVGRWTKGTSLGLMDALSNIASEVSRDNAGIHPKPKEIALGLDSGHIRGIPLEPYARRWLDPLAETAAENIMSVWKEPKRFDLVVFAGGGGAPELLGLRLESLIGAHYSPIMMFPTVEASSMSIVRGMLKLGIYWKNKEG
jgi:hypothetical protein